MSISVIIIICVLALLIVYTILDKLVFPWIRFNKNKKKVATWIFCTFFHPTGGFTKSMLCKPIGAHFIEVPEEHKEYFPRTQDNRKPQYCLIGTQVVGTDSDGNPLEEPIRLTLRGLWPPGAKESEQVPVEMAYFVIGREEALNPFKNFMAINTELSNLIMREERSMEAANAQQNKELENWQTLESRVIAMAKGARIQLFATLGALACSGVAAVLAYMAYSTVKKML